jgi:hypothetical protein
MSDGGSFLDASQQEQPLGGGYVSAVVRIGNTVRAPDFTTAASTTRIVTLWRVGGRRSAAAN